MKSANFVTEVTVIDPESHAPVEVAIYKDCASGAMFGVDSSYLGELSENDAVLEPFNGSKVQLIER